MKRNQVKIRISPSRVKHKNKEKNLDQFKLSSKPVQLHFYPSLKNIDITNIYYYCYYYYCNYDYA